MFSSRNRLNRVAKAVSDKLARRDKIIGTWSLRLFRRNGVSYVTSTIKGKGLDPIIETERSRSIWGVGDDLKNIRKGKGGHSYADVYDDSQLVGIVKLHRDFSFYKNYGGYLDGRYKTDLRSGRVTLWDNDLSHHWVSKAQSYI